MPDLSTKCQCNNCYSVCEENECSVIFPSQLELFADGEKVIDQGKRCDCIAVFKKIENGGIFTLEIYSIELKSISDWSKVDKALAPDSLIQKCYNCLEWARNEMLKKLKGNIVNITISTYCITAIPLEVFNRIGTLIKRRLSSKPKNADHVKIIKCNGTLTDEPLFKI